MQVGSQSNIANRTHKGTGVCDFADRQRCGVRLGNVLGLGASGRNSCDRACSCLLNMDFCITCPATTCLCENELIMTVYQHGCERSKWKDRIGQVKYDKAVNSFATPLPESPAHLMRRSSTASATTASARSRVMVHPMVMEMCLDRHELAKAREAESSVD